MAELLQRETHIKKMDSQREQTRSGCNKRKKWERGRSNITTSSILYKQDFHRAILIYTSREYRPASQKCFKMVAWALKQHQSGVRGWAVVTLQRTPALQVTCVVLKMPPSREVTGKVTGIGCLWQQSYLSSNPWTCPAMPSSIYSVSALPYSSVSSSFWLHFFSMEECPSSTHLKNPPPSLFASPVTTPSSFKPIHCTQQCLLSHLSLGHFHLNMLFSKIKSRLIPPIMLK